MIALIPARGGSKGLPNKNIKPLLGKPLIAYSIEVALKSDFIDEVYVSTDCEEIAKIAISFGAKVPFLRPDYLASDSSLAIDTYIYMLNQWKNEGKQIEDFIVLQPTSPLRNVKQINESIKMFKEKNADSVISYTKESHPISWHRYLKEDFSFELNSDQELANRQETRPTFYPNGAIYIFKAELILKKEYYSQNSFAYIMDKQSAIDIDFIEDFQYAEFLLSKNNNNE